MSGEAAASSSGVVLQGLDDVEEFIWVCPSVFLFSSSSSSFYKKRKKKYNCRTVILQE
jgi:hypothetical protein